MRADVVIGVAVDVSGSMQQSIRNEAGEDLSRIRSLRDTLSRIVDNAGESLNRRAGGQRVSADVFAYAFGLKDAEPADLLSLITILRKIKAGTAGSASEKPLPVQSGSTKFDDPFKDLEDQAISWDVPGWGYDAKEYLDRSEAENLARLLRQNPHEAQNLARQIKENGWKVRASRMAGYVPIVGGWRAVSCRLACSRQ